MSLFERRRQRHTNLAEARFKFLFEEAQQELPTRTAQIFTGNAARGHLKSGATIRQSVRAADELAQTAVASSLDAVTRSTPGGGNRRKVLLDVLSAQLRSFLDSSAQEICASIEAVGLNPELAKPLFDDVRRRRTEQIEQYRGGWTTPEGKNWKERHPAGYDILLAVISGLIGLAAGWIARSPT